MPYTPKIEHLLFEIDNEVRGKWRCFKQAHEA